MLPAKYEKIEEALEWIIFIIYIIIYEIYEFCWKIQQKIVKKLSAKE